MNGEPGHWPARRFLDRARGEPTRTLYWLEKALAADPECAPALLHRAAIALTRGDRGAAIADFKRLDALKPDFLLRYGGFDLPHPPPREILSAVNLFLADNPKSPWGWVVQAFCLRALLNFKENVKAMEKAVALRPHSAALSAILSRARFTQTYPASALRDLEKARRMAPHCGWITAWRGEAARQLGRPEEALRFLDRAAKLDPSYPNVHFWRGGVLRLLGRSSMAAAALRAGLEGLGSNAWARNELFQILREQGNLRAAISELNRTHALNSRYTWSSPHREPQEILRGLAPLADQLKRRPRDHWARFWLGQSLLDAGELNASLGEFNLCLKNGFSHPWVHEAKARCLERLGNPSAAASYTRALSLDPRFAHAYAGRARLKAASGDHAGAIKDLDLALKLDPVCAWGYLLRGRSYAAVGRAGAAGEDARRALTILPGWREAEEFLAGLTDLASPKPKRRT